MKGSWHHRGMGVLLAIAGLEAMAMAGPASAPSTKPAAQRIVFCCQASGSMMTHWPHLREEVGAAVDALDSTQKFDLIAFRTSQKDSVTLSDNLVPGTEENKDKACKILQDTNVSGTSDPVFALMAVVKLHPDTIWFLGNPSNYKDKNSIIEAGCS